MEFGKLYKTKKLYWFLYRSQDEINISLGPSATTTIFAQYWSNKCKASYIPPNSLFVLLEKKQKHCRVLSPEGNIGWIYLAGWCKDDIEEVKAEG